MTSLATRVGSTPAAVTLDGIYAERERTLVGRLEVTMLFASENLNAKFKTILLMLSTFYTQFLLLFNSNLS
jgi:hypothetical protein